VIYIEFQGPKHQNMGKQKEVATKIQKTNI